MLVTGIVMYVVAFTVATLHPQIYLVTDQFVITSALALAIMIVPFYQSAFDLTVRLENVVDRRDYAAVEQWSADVTTATTIVNIIIALSLCNISFIDQAAKFAAVPTIVVIVLVLVKTVIDGYKELITQLRL